MGAWQGLKPGVIGDGLRGAEAPLFHGAAGGRGAAGVHGAAGGRDGLWSCGGLWSWRLPQRLKPILSQARTARLKSCPSRAILLGEIAEPET